MDESSGAGYQEGINENDEDKEVEITTLQKLKNLEPLNPEVNFNADKVEVDTTSRPVLDDDQNAETIEIPTLVIEIFMEWLKDVELLKTCRLVNNYWNSLACSSMQCNSIAKLDDKYKQLEKFLEFLKPKSSRKLSLHASPFKNVHIKTKIWNERSIDNYCPLFEIPYIKITSLEISIFKNEMEKLNGLNRFFKSTMKELINLTIIMPCKYISHVFHDVRFSALQSLCIVECYHGECHHAAHCLDPLRRALDHSRLQQLTSGVNSRTRFRSPFASSLINNKLSCVVELTLLYITDEEETFWNQLPKVKLPLLKSLTFNSMMRHFQEIVQDRHLEINAFLSNVASTLIKLDFCYGRPQPNSGLRFREIVFPKLKYLLLTYPDEIYECFTPARFPSLQTLHLYYSHMKQLQIPDEFEPLGTLRILDVFFVIRDDETDSEDDDTDSDEDEVGEVIPFPMLNWSRKFSNVESFGASLYHRKYSLSLVDRLEAFPNLKCLRHPDSNDFTAPPGTPDEEFEEYKRAGRLIEKIVFVALSVTFNNFACTNCK